MFDQKDLEAQKKDNRELRIESLLPLRTEAGIKDFEEHFFKDSNFKCKGLESNDADFYHTSLKGKSFNDQIVLAAEHRKSGEYKKSLLTYATRDAGFSSRTYERIRSGKRLNKETVIEAVIPFEFISPDEKIEMINNAGYFLSDTIPADRIIKELILQGLTETAPLDPYIFAKTGELYFDR